MTRSRTTPTGFLVIAAALVAACSRPDDLPEMALTEYAVRFDATGPTGDPSAAVVQAVNAGRGFLAPPTAAIAYQQGTGWLEVDVGGASAPYTVLLQPRTAALAPGTYRAGVTLTSGSPSAKPAYAEVTLTVPGPSYAVSTTSLSFEAPRTGDPAPATLRVTNGGRGTLPLADVQIAYEGASGGWLTAVVSATAEGYAVAVQAREVTGMASGYHTAKLSIGSSLADRKTVDVTLRIPPELAVSASLTPFVPAPTDAAPLTQTFTVRNTGRGLLPPPHVLVTGAVGWVSTSVTGSGEIYTVAVTADGWRRYGAGDYPAKLTLFSDGMTGSPPEVDVLLRVGPAAMRPSGSVAWTAYQGCPLPGAQVVTVENVGVGYLTRPTVTIPPEAAAWLDAEVVGSWAPFRVVFSTKAAPPVAAGATASTTVTLSENILGQAASPVQVPVSYALRTPAITGTQATPSPLVIHAQAGTGDPAPAVLSVLTAGGCIPPPTLTFAYGPGEPAWLSWKVSTAAQRHDLTLQASTTGMAPGSVYHLGLNVTSFASGDNTPVFTTTVPLTLDYAKLEPTGALSTTRFDHAAVALADGGALVIGGTYNPGTVPAFGALASVERYDPASGRFVPYPSLLQARTGAAAVALGDGRVVVCGGSSLLEDLRTCEISAGGAWSAFATLQRARPAPALVVAGAKLVVVGQAGPYSPQPSEEVELVDLTTGEVAFAMAPGPERVRGTAAVVLADGTVLVTGNLDGASWRYDPVYELWSRTGAGVFGTAPALVALHDGRVLSTRGSRTELWDPRTGAWSGDPRLAVGAADSTYRYVSGDLVVLGNGKVVALNGERILDAATADVELFDPARGTWSIVQGVAVPAPALGARIVRLADGRLLVSGGKTPSHQSVAGVFTW